MTHDRSSLSDPTADVAAVLPLVDDGVKELLLLGGEDGAAEGVSNRRGVVVGVGFLPAHGGMGNPLCDLVCNPSCGSRRCGRRSEPLLTDVLEALQLRL
jgi:hypothetical protein